MQWIPALILILPAWLAWSAARRPGAIKILAAVLVTFLLDGMTAFAFWLQADVRSQGDTIRLIFFVAVPAGVITTATLLALVRGMALLASPSVDTRPAQAQNRGGGQ